MTTLPATLTAGTWNLDAAHTEVGFTVRHAGISKVRGSFTETEGKLTIGADADSCAVEVKIATASVNTRNQGRDDHLRSGDFFDSEQFPEMVFASTSVAAKGDEAVIKGNLTIKDVTREVELEAEFNGAGTDPFGAARIGFSAETTINRKDFGLTWNAAMETGGLLVGDKIKIQIEAEFVQA